MTMRLSEEMNDSGRLSIQYGCDRREYERKSVRRAGREKVITSVYFQGLTILPSKEYQSFSTLNPSTLLPDINAKICKIYMKYRIGQCE